MKPRLLLAPSASSISGGSENMTRAEAAKYLRLSPAQVSNLANGRVPGVPRLRCSRPGRRLIFKRVWLDEFIESIANE